jgi:beta-glucosidase-like glycosyl hydrolase
VRIDLPARRLRSALAPYRRCARGQALVMVASAIYPQLTGRAPAVLSRALYARELPAVGFHGLTISDDLEAPSLASEEATSRRAAAAGLDLLLYALHESRSADEYRRLLADLRAGRLSKRRVLAADARIRAFKRRLVADRRR